jgi:hypothetical protein
MVPPTSYLVLYTDPSGRDVRCGISAEPLQNVNKLFGLDAPMRAFDLDANRTV